MASRAYEIRPGEALHDGLRRAAKGRASKAIERLEDADEDFAAAVHGARKDLKKLRSLIRLVRAGLGEKAYRAENDRFRAVAGSLGGARDAEAKLECLSALREHYSGEFPTRWSGDFVGALEAERDRIAAQEAETGTGAAVAAIEEGLEAIDDWKLKPHGFGLAAPGLERAYRRGRERFRDVLDDPSDVAVHEWRKRAKDLWYQLQLLQDGWPAVLGAVSAQAHELSAILGDHHDLAVVREDAEARSDLFGGEAQAQLLELLARRQGELTEQAAPFGRRLYAEKPGRFVDRVGAYWATR